MVANSGGLTVALDIHITDDLRKEGIARELVNRIQNIRKDKGFEVTDKITVKLQNNKAVEDAVLENIDYIKNETLTESLTFDKTLKNGEDIVFDDISTQIEIDKNI